MALQIRSNVPAPQPSMIHRRKKMGWTRPGEGIIARSFREEANRGPAPGGPLRIDVGALSPLPWAWRPCLILNHFLGLFRLLFTPWIQLGTSPLPLGYGTAFLAQGQRAATIKSCTRTRSSCTNNVQTARAKRSSHDEKFYKRHQKEEDCRSSIQSACS